NGFLSLSPILHPPPPTHPLSQHDFPAISVNYNCQCGGHRTLAENMREQFSPGNTPALKSCSTQRKTIGLSPYRPDTPFQK
uniref:Uncharacterized protein n=1 Tax=Cynoglossus semilaevis TaxID=244447 RepID=A0A3P8VCM9_CYNSE